MDARNALFGRSGNRPPAAGGGLPGREVRRDQPPQQGRPIPPPQDYNQAQRQPQQYGQNNYQQPPRPPPQQQMGRPQQDPRSYGSMAPQPQIATLYKLDVTEIMQTNRSAVSEHLFPNAESGPAAHIAQNGKREFYMLVDGHVVTARQFRYPDQGNFFSLNKFQRAWLKQPEIMSASVKSNMELQPYDGPKTPLARVNISLDFANPNQKNYDGKMFLQEELGQYFLQHNFGNFFAPDQSGMLPSPQFTFRFTVDNVQFMDPQTEKMTDASMSERDRGILTETTEVIFHKAQGSNLNIQLDNRAPAKNSIIRPDFKFADMGIGGLDEEFSTIFRRAFASRVFPPGLVQQMGISHVKGLLLFGPPGTGKTLIARQIGKMLNAREPKIINGPEILNKYVGQSEENVRKVFKDAEDEYKEKGDASDLHIIIFDELDAVCKQRGSTGGGTGVGDSIVNQLLTKLDGVDSLNNILLIGMTNRKDMIDEALLRPGRLEVHMEISLPDEHGRLQILNIHTAKVRGMNKLAADVNIEELAKTTKNFSGAELNGLVKAALSYAFTRHTKIGDVTGVEGRPEDVMLTRDDFMRALEDVKPAYGVSEEELEASAPNGIVHYSPHIDTILSNGSNYVKQVQTQGNAPLLSVLIHGASGAGKTALAAEIGLRSKFPFVKLVRPIDVGTSEQAKLEYLRRVFADAYKSSLSMVVLDRIETIIDWNPTGPRFSNTVVQYISALLQTAPPKGRRLMIVATTSRRQMLDMHDALEFDREITVPTIRDLRELRQLLVATEKLENQVVDEALRELQENRGSDSVGVGVKAVFSAMETALVREDLPIASCLASELGDIINQRNPQHY